MPDDLITLRGQVERLRVDTDPESVSTIILSAKNQVAYSRETQRLLMERLLDWIEANGAIQVEDQRFYVGRQSKTKLSVPAGHAIDTLFGACEGDIEQLGKLLAASPIKHGAVKTLLGQEIFDLLFTVEVDEKVKKVKAAWEPGS